MIRLKEIQLGLVTLVIIMVMAAGVPSSEEGKKIYQKNCIHCHMEDGQGLPGVFPPVVSLDYYQTDLGRAIKSMSAGVSGELVVNGKKYFGVMSPSGLTDQQMADVMNYLLKQSSINRTLSAEDVAKLKQ
ncbi:MAG: cytochrome c [Cyclobacteriaceae bacterium]